MAYNNYDNIKLIISSNESFENAHNPTDAFRIMKFYIYNKDVDTLITESGSLRAVQHRIKRDANELAVQMLLKSDDANVSSIYKKYAELIKLRDQITQQLPIYYNAITTKQSEEKARGKKRRKTSRRSTIRRSIKKNSRKRK